MIATRRCRRPCVAFRAHGASRRKRADHCRKWCLAALDRLRSSLSIPRNGVSGASPCRMLRRGGCVHSARSLAADGISHPRDDSRIHDHYRAALGATPHPFSASLPHCRPLLAAGKTTALAHSGFADQPEGEEREISILLAVAVVTAFLGMPYWPSGMGCPMSLSTRVKPSSPLRKFYLLL